jgi:hypothetical protein
MKVDERAITAPLTAKDDAEPADTTETQIRKRGFTPVGEMVRVPADDGTNGILRVQKADCEARDGRGCEKLFIFYNQKLLGTDTLKPSWGIRSVTPFNDGEFEVEYENPPDSSKQDSVVVLYSWYGAKLTATGTPPTRP